MAADTGVRAQDAIDRPIGEGATSQSPTDTPNKVSSATSISIDFSVPMDRNDVEERFAISPEDRWVADMEERQHRLHSTGTPASGHALHDQRDRRARPRRQRSWAGRATSRSSCSPVHS